MGISRYDYSNEGMSVFGSFERFNKALYGGHASDITQNRFFTFAGDTPIFMGASSDYTKDTWCYQAKNGILMSGLALTPGYVDGVCGDNFSRWFHECSDTTATWHHGYITYDFTSFSPYFPNTRVKMAVYPLNPDDGFLVTYDITTDQRVNFCLGFGGITPFFGRFEYHVSVGRNFCVADCKNNTVEVLNNRSCTVSGPCDVSMLLGTDFDCQVTADGPAAMEEAVPSMFMTDHADGEGKIAKLTRVIEAGEHFRGRVVVMYKGTTEKLQAYLEDEKAEQKLRTACREKYAMADMSTPVEALNCSFRDTIIAEDASFHGKSFYHGAIGYHAPFLGWRGWYAPTLLGWYDRVKSAILTHFDTIVKPNGEEKVWWDGADRPDLDHEGTQYHHLQNSPGHLTALLFKDDIYDMQEVALDMTIFHLERSGDLETAREIFSRILAMLDWEERILDPDGDGLYQNFLNTWISDGHSYDGAGCAQASAYNYSANLRCAKIARALGDNDAAAKLEKRAGKIREAAQRLLWIDADGVMAESLDTIGNKLLHPSPELSTVYLAIDNDLVDIEQGARMLQWVEKNIVSVRTKGPNDGRLYFSANWLPKKYSTCGLFPAENCALALAYYKCLMPEKGYEIIRGMADTFALSPYPGSITHVQTGSGAPDGSNGGDIDFTDVSSCYLRLLIEGLWGVHIDRIARKATIAPMLPADWKEAELVTPDVSLHFRRCNDSDRLTIALRKGAELDVEVKLPARYPAIDSAFVNGKASDFTATACRGFRLISYKLQGNDTVVVEQFYCKCPGASLKNTELSAFAGSDVTFEIVNCDASKIRSIAAPGVCLVQTVQNGANAVCLANVCKNAQEGGIQGYVDCTDILLPFTLNVLKAVPSCVKAALASAGPVSAIDITGLFNCSVTEVHKQEFRSPRPAGYSIGQRLNGRYAWEWNHYGHNALHVDDSLLRGCGGVFATPDGWTFATPAAGANCLSVSIWDNFPTEIAIPVNAAGQQLAILFCGTTNAMQTAVVNAEFEVVFSDGTVSKAQLILPKNFDDMLHPVYQQGNAYQYIGEGTHALIQVFDIDGKQVKELRARAVANEVIINILGVSIR